MSDDMTTANERERVVKIIDAMLLEVFSTKRWRTEDGYIRWGAFQADLRQAIRDNGAETWRDRQAKDAQRLMSGALKRPPATEREERLEEALWRIAQWADAYPTEIFPEVDAEYHSRARKALEADGMTLDRLSASAMRHVVQGVGKIAKEALR